MFKKGVVWLLVLAWVVTPVVSFGDDLPRGRWWDSPRVARRLDLTYEQVRQLDRLFVENRRKLIDLKTVVERERFELENLIEMPRLDDDAVMVQFRRLETARSNLAAERFRFLLGVRKILGYEKFQQLKVLFGQSRQRKRPVAPVERFESEWFN